MHKLAWVFTLGFSIAAFACGGAVIDTSAEDDGSVNPTCLAVCVANDDCCPGYACEGGACKPHLNDDRCWSSSFTSTCDPRLQNQCAEAESCTADRSLDIACHPSQRIGKLGDPCGAGAGCGPGLWCSLDLCREACCSDGDCPDDMRCGINHGQIGSFGVCRERS